jgi:hypothetical protein
MTDDRTEEALMTTVTTLPVRRELAHRYSNGIDVTLSWSPGDDVLLVTVCDEAGDDFELVVESHEALDVFEHPYAYAAYRGLHVVDVAA